MSRTLLVRNARCIATFDHPEPGQARELRDASILIRGNLIESFIQGAGSAARGGRSD